MLSRLICNLKSPSPTPRTVNVNSWFPQSHAIVHHPSTTGARRHTPSGCYTQVSSQLPMPCNLPKWE